MRVYDRHKARKGESDMRQRASLKLRHQQAGTSKQLRPWLQRQHTCLLALLCIGHLVRTLHLRVVLSVLTLVVMF